MYDGDTVDDDWGEGDPQDTGTRGTTEGDQRDGGPRGQRGQERPAEWKAEGAGRWTRASSAEGGKAQPRTIAGGGWAAQTANGTTTTHSAGERASATDGGGGTKGGGADAQEVDEGDEATTERSGKHRRRQTEAERGEEERRASDARRAQELQEQLQRASAAQQQSYQEGTGGFGSEVALSWAAQKFVLDVQRAQAQAGEMGIEPKAEDGRSLLQLSPMELKQWIEQHLDEGSMHD